MRLFEVSTDSTADLYEDYRKKRDIWFAPLSFSFEKDGKIEEYLDNFSEYSQYVDFYNKVRNKYMPRTAMLNYEAHVSHFTAMAKTGVKDVLHFSISSGLARTTQVAKQAAEEVKKEYPDFNMVSVDPLGATILQGMLVTLACDMRDEGKTMQETYEYLTDARNRILCTIIPTDLFYLQRGGRVSATAAVFGSMLGVKPILTFDHDGKLKTIDKVKGMKRVYAYTLEKMTIAPPDEKKKIVVVHTDNEEAAEEMAKRVEEAMGIKPEIYIMGPSIGAHVGPGAVACGWLSTKTRTELGL